MNEIRLTISNNLRTNNEDSSRKPAEYQAVERLTYQAFKELNLTENWRPTEHFIVHLLRESADFIPELSLVSETDQGKLTGHIMSSKAKLRLPDHTEKAVLTVGPLSVHPEAQNTGVGSALIKHSVQKAKELGIGGLIILGHPTYYTKFGFVPATTFQITLPEKKHQKHYWLWNYCQVILAQVVGSGIFQHALLIQKHTLQN